MATGTKTFTKAELFELFKLATKFNNDQGLLPLTIANFTDQQADDFADDYLAALTDKDDFEPLGRKLARVTNEHVSDVIDVVNTPGSVTTTYNTATAFKTGTNTLFAGTGNPATKLAVASNGKLELALGVRRHNDLDLPTPTNGEYVVELADETKDWTVVFSAGLLNGTTTNVTELYDVAVTFFGTAAGNANDPKLTLNMVRTAAGYDWVSADGSYHATAAGTNAAKSVGQDIQRYSFFPQIVDEDYDVGTIVTGDYKITLKAVHKKTAEVLQVSVLAKVSVAEA